MCRRSVDARQRSLPELLCRASKWKERKKNSEHIRPREKEHVKAVDEPPHSSVYTVCVNILPQQHCVCEHDFNSGPFNIRDVALQLQDHFQHALIIVPNQPYLNVMGAELL